MARPSRKKRNKSSNQQRNYIVYVSFQCYHKTDTIYTWSYPSLWNLNWIIRNAIVSTNIRVLYIGVRIWNTRVYELIPMFKRHYILRLHKYECIHNVLRCLSKKSVMTSYIGSVDLSNDPKTNATVPVHIECTIATVSALNTEFCLLSPNLLAVKDLWLSFIKEGRF